MQQDTWTQLDTIFRDMPTLKAEPVSYEEIDEVSSLNGYRFPEDYREFIHRYGGATVGPYNIYGLRSSLAMTDDEASVFDVTTSFRKDNWPGTEKWLVISIDHAGNPIGMDQEGAIWISDHDNQCIEKIANGLEAYILNWCLSQ